MEKAQRLVKNVGLKVLEAGLFFTVVSTGVVSAQLQEGVESSRPTDAPENLFGVDSVFQTIANILLFVLGAVAVIMLIIGGFRYVVSGGDSGAVESAKNTILYAIIGIIVAFLAYAAVNFIVGQLGDAT